MKMNEIKWSNIDLMNYSVNPIPSGMPYKRLMQKGKAFPINKPQALFFVQMGCLCDELNNEDVRVIELLLNKHNIEGNYRYAGNHGRVKLVNSCDLDKALKMEFNF